LRQKSRHELFFIANAARFIFWSLRLSPTLLAFVERRGLRQKSRHELFFIANAARFIFWSLRLSPTLLAFAARRGLRQRAAMSCFFYRERRSIYFLVAPAFADAPGGRGVAWLAPK
jgi:hypothetical protein